jgi:hypothetical protein
MKTALSRQKAMARLRFKWLPNVSVKTSVSLSALQLIVDHAACALIYVYLTGEHVDCAGLHYLGSIKDAGYMIVVNGRFILAAAAGAVVGNKNKKCNSEETSGEWKRSKQWR